MTAPEANTSPDTPRPPSRRGYWLLGTLVVLIVAGWTAYWAIARGMAGDLLHNAVAVANAEGGALVCGDEALGGYPFQIRLDCAPLEARDAEGRALALGALRAIAMAYNPRHLILEAQAPARLTLPDALPGGTLALDWTNARASARVGDTALARADIALEGPSASLATGRVEAAHMSVNLRRTPEAPENADLALRLDEARVPGLTAPLQLFATATVADGAALFGGGGDMRATLSAPDAIRVTQLRVDSEAVSLSAEGTLWLDGQGRLSGELPLTVTGVDALPALLAPFFPAGSNVPTALQGAIAGFGTPTTLDGAPAVTVPLTFRAGTARVGLIPIAALAPLY